MGHSPNMACELGHSAVFGVDARQDLSEPHAAPWTWRMDARAVCKVPFDQGIGRYPQTLK